MILRTLFFHVRADCDIATRLNFIHMSHDVHVVFWNACVILASRWIFILSQKTCQFDFVCILTARSHFSGVACRIFTTCIYRIWLVQIEAIWRCQEGILREIFDIFCPFLQYIHRILQRSLIVTCGHGRWKLTSTVPILHAWTSTLFHKILLWFLETEICLFKCRIERICCLFSDLVHFLLVLMRVVTALVLKIIGLLDC